MKYAVIVALLTLSALAFVASSSRSAEAIDPETQRMIQQDHIMVGLLVNYIGEMQERGVLPKQEVKK